MPIESKVFSYKNRSAPIEYSTVQLPDELGPNEILVETHYVGLNPVDIKYKEMVLFDTGKSSVGLDFSGIVLEAGSNASSRFKPGDKVTGFKKKLPWNASTVGSISKIDISRNGVMHQPKVLSDEEAGGYSLVFATAWEMIRSSKIDPNSTVLVLGGATSVGCLLVQLLKRYHKVKRVIATCSPRSSVDVKAYGADEVVDYRASDYLEQLKKAAQKEKFLSIYDCAGGNAVISISDHVLAPLKAGSTYVAIAGDVDAHANYSDGAVLENLVGLTRTALRLAFGKWFNINYKFPFSDYVEWPEIAPEIIDEHKIHIKVGKVFPAADIKEAWKALDKLSGGKIVLKF